MVEALKNSTGVVCLPADGTFYCFPYVQAIIGRTDGVAYNVELTEYLLDKAGVALVPGTAFGAPGYLRLSFRHRHGNIASGAGALDERIDRLSSYSYIARLTRLTIRRMTGSDCERAIHFEPKNVRCGTGQAPRVVVPRSA